MTTLTRRQRTGRGRFEALIALAAPALDLVLAVGDRVSRLTSTEEYDHYAVPSPSERLPLTPGGSSVPKDAA